MIERLNDDACSFIENISKKVNGFAYTLLIFYLNSTDYYCRDTSRRKLTLKRLHKKTILKMKSKVNQEFVFSVSFNIDISLQEIGSVEHIAKRLKHSSLSSSAIAIISPTASSIRRQYHFRQQNYATWCSARQLSYRDPSPQQTINYLANLYATHGLKFSTLAIYSNLILALFSAKDQQAIKHSEPYVTFLKALKAKTILPPQHWSYDMVPAISYIVSLSSTDAL